jgi:dihydrofolate reductase
MIKAILATDFKNGIGKNGTLPWIKNKEDLKHFKEKTIHNIVVMGSKTWEDPIFPRPLKDRENYVITSKNSGFSGATIISSNILETIIQLDKNSQKDVWIIGGTKIFELCKDIIEEWHITKFVGNFDCDVFLKFDDYKNLEIQLINKINDNYYLIYRRKN